MWVWSAREHPVHLIGVHTHWERREIKMEMVDREGRAIHVVLT